MYVHLSSPFLQAVSLHLFYLGRVPFFLVLAGYFLGRNITWNKAFNRAFWLFIPFMFWNVLYVFLVLPHDGASFRLENLIGIRDVFLPGMNLFSADDSHAVPPIGPSWFLRDIIILTLLTPLLVRVKILLFPAVLLFFCFFILGTSGLAVPFLSGGDCVRLCRGRVPDPAQPPAQGPQP